MRIVQLVPAMAGGAQAHEALEFAQELARQGHDSIVISTGGALVSRLTLHGCQHFTLSVDRKRQFNFRLHGKLRQLLTTLEPDILLARGPLCCWHGWMVWKKMSVASRPHLVTWSQERSRKRGLFSSGIGSAVARGELVLAASQWLGQELQQKFGSLLADSNTSGKGNPRTLYRGVNTRELDRHAQVSGHWHQRLLNDFPQLEGRNWLLLPGPVAPGRGQQRFLELIAALKQEREDVFGLVIGDVEPGQEKFARALERQAASMGLNEYVLFLGARRDMRELYGSARLTLDLADAALSNGRSVAEALAMGCPAIAASGTSVELLRHCFPRGVVDSLDVAQLVSVSSEILSNAETVHFDGFSLAQTTARAVGWFDALLDVERAGAQPGAPGSEVV
ncbi:glycosyltransferase [Microbulbifer bruguierae]|uniref:Glycosyltransferase n=1 Tax=Microbulbifer bruguierae TaxID=3029061 RepID=A0ABY8NCW4_9GAMM|nr:glycosyltransferase [Microbulbifer bruguierae]WGL16763.1 glycosyltransferase [Microbulbifer bruguierae]